VKRDYILLGLFALLAVVFPQFVENNYYRGVMVEIGIILVLVVGLNLIIGYAGQISLGHAGFYGMGAFLTMMFTSDRTPLEDWVGSFAGPLVPAAAALHSFFASHMVLAWIAAAIITGLLALIVGIPTLRLKGHYLAMATLGLGIILQIVFKEENLATGGPSGMSVPYFKIMGSEVNPNTATFYYLVWAVVLASLVLSINLVHSRIGRALKSIHEDDMAAAASGVPVMKMKVMIFTVGAMYASIAGSLYAHYLTHVNPAPFGFMFSVKLVVMVVVGGMGSIWGSIMGTGLLTTMPHFLTVFEDYEIALYGLVLIVVMIFSPKGLAGLIDSGWKWTRHKLAKEEEGGDGKA